MRTLDYADTAQYRPMRGGTASREAHSDHVPHVVDSVTDPQAAGNQAVQRLFRAGLIQAKLNVSEPNDPDEQEADRVADQIMDMPEPAVQRECVTCAPKTPCSKCDVETINRNVAPGHSPEASVGFSAHIASLHGGGQPLPASTRAFFEPRFGTDLSRVRLHTDKQAAQSAMSIQARAFAIGQHVVFGPGEFMPESREGRKLLAHELAHIVQTGQASRTSTDAETATPVFRQTTASPGTPGGPDPCLNLLQQIIDLLNLVAELFNNAVDDKHELFKYHRRLQDAHPEYGSWDGHRDNYNQGRDRLRQKIAEWEADDNCRGYRLSKQEQEELKEAEEFGNKVFPEKPAKSMSKAYEEEGESVWDKLRKYLPEILVIGLMAIGAYMAGAAIAACFATGACEFGLVLAGLGFLLVAGITAVLRAAGVQDKTSSGSVALSDQSQEGNDETA